VPKHFLFLILDFCFLFSFCDYFNELFGRGERERLERERGSGRGMRLSQTPNNQSLKLQHLV
ncbi:MAG: hypothetical protein J6S67_18045, partial [Methanobrevibacter sp.]|nr:hypothetical protein [Methanobrevibacter sp.]